MEDDGSEDNRTLFVKNVNFKTKEVQARIAAVAEAQGVKAVDVVIDADDFEAVLAPHMAEFRRVAFRERRATEAAATAKILSAMSGTKTAAGKALLGKASASKFAQKMAARRLKKATADLAGDGAVAEAGIETPSTDDADEEKGGGGGNMLRIKILTMPSSSPHRIDLRLGFSSHSLDDE
jgi:hypothetical protein